jgi:hypothetical protein
MKPGPTPLPKAPAPDEIEARRSLWCPAYERCLDVALRGCWRSWTCEFCSQFLSAGPFRKLEAARSFHARRNDLPPDGSAHTLLP